MASTLPVETRSRDVYLKALARLNIRSRQAKMIMRELYELELLGDYEIIYQYPEEMKRVKSFPNDEARKAFPLVLHGMVCNCGHSPYL